MEQLCPSCHIPVTSTDDGMIVCEECGRVLDDAQIVPEVELSEVADGYFRPSGTIVSSIGNFSLTSGAETTSTNQCAVQIARESSPQNNFLFRCSRIAGLLKLSNPLREQMIHLMSQLTNGSYPSGRKAELMIASCAYIACRLNSKPITLLDVSNSLSESVWDLGRVYTRVVTKLKIKLSAVDPALYLERAVARLELTQEQYKNVNNLALRILNVAKEDWLSPGRRPEALTAAAIKLAVATLKIEAPLERINKTLCVADYTVKVRYAELRDTFAQRALEIPYLNPLPRQFKSKLPLYVMDILKYLDFLKSTPQQIDSTCVREKFPPSFHKNIKLREKRMEKLERAKRRIARALQANIEASKALQVLVAQQPGGATNPIVSSEEDKDTEDLDKEDLLIERSLLEGVSESDILQGYYFAPDERLVVGEDVELTEKDIPEHELIQFIKSKEEIERTKHLYEQIDDNVPVTKKRKVHTI